MTKLILSFFKSLIIPQKNISTGVILLRKLLPSMALILIVIGILRYEGEQAGLYSTFVGLVLMVVIATLLLGAVIVWSATTIDELQAKQNDTMEKLDVYRKELEDLYNKAPCGYHSLDHKGVFQKINDTELKWLGYHRDELIGRRSFRELLTEESKKRFDVTFPLFLEKGEIFDLEFDLVKKDGGTLSVLLSATSLRDNNNKIIKTRSTVYDITNRLILEEKLALQQKMIAQASKFTALGEMAGGIAHEINNPLGIIHSKTDDIRELLSDENLDRKKIEEHLDRIEATLIRITKIIKSLQTISRDMSNEPFRAVALKGIIEDALELCKERMRANNIKLVGSAVPDDLLINCREVEISQVLLNLLNNSFDAVVNLNEAWIKIEVTSNKDEVEILLSDSGPGIPESVKEKIFQPFFTTKEIGKGTGLGLSISKGIIDSHKGSLNLKLNASHTCFVITLPKFHPQPLKGN